MKSAARWVWNHKRLLVGTSVVAAGAYAGYVAWQKKREFDALCEELLGVQGGARPRTDETRAKEHFDATQQEVNGVVSRELTKVRQQLKRLLDTEALTQELRSGKKFEQAQWNELKVMVWTRLLSSVYALVLLELKLRIHINIVARHYLHETSSAHHAAEAGSGSGGDGGGGDGGGSELNGSRASGGSASGLSRLTKLRFLSTEPLCTEGFEPLVRSVRDAAAAELASVSLDQQLSVDQLEAVVGRIRARLETDTPGSSAAAATAATAAAAATPGAGGASGASGASGAGASAVRSFLVGGLGAGGAVATGDQLEALLDEVREILQSEPYRIVLADVLNASFEGLHGLLRLKLEAGTATEGAGALPASVPMAKLIPRLSKLLPTVTADDLGANPIAKAVAEVSTLGEFSWMVYTAGPLFAGAQ